MAVALIGNPNSGKTTLFNALTGKRQHVGNWPGVTVDIKEGIFHYKGHRINIVDLPGIYSLDPDTLEQRTTRNYLTQFPPELIINIVDAGNLERSLYLTMQLLKLGRPVLLALNMMDEVEKAGAELDADKLSFFLGIPAIAISAVKEKGLDKLAKTIHDAIEGRAAPPSAPGICISCTMCKNTENIYKCIEDIVRQVYTTKLTQKQADITRKLDRVLLNKWLAIPLLLLIMLSVFFITFGATGWLTDLINAFLSGTLSPFTGSLLSSAGAPAWLTGLLCSGVIPGVGSVLAFLPQIAILFILTSFLEDSGYMARAAFIMDKAFSKIGLGGGAFMPLLMGFGCSVPAVMATRTLPSEKERRLTIMLIPFMSCSAKMPVYALFAGAFFARYQGLAVFGIYFIGIFIAVLSGFILNKLVFKTQKTPFIMEIPPYRFPTAKNLLLHSAEKVKGFLVKAGTVLLAASLVIWALQYFTPSFTLAANPSESIIAFIGRGLAPVFSPIGLSDWRASVALVTGVAAKEAIVSTLGVLSGSGQAGLTEVLRGIFSPLQAFTFMTFSLLYIPCVATIATIGKEMRSVKWTFFTVVYGLVIAYTLSFIIFNAGKLLGF
ncbi:MAG: ferrous iron transport protein B [Bacillota bacterium]|nr:ferrous iron transport protein B [Bacillota bacterium]